MAAALLAAALVGGLWLFSRPASPTLVEAATVERTDVERILTTNGRIEAARRSNVYAETLGLIVRLPVAVGEELDRGETIAVIDDTTGRSELAQAQARLRAARADRAALDRGPDAARRAELQSELDDLEARERSLREDLERTERLIAKQAAPLVEKQRLERELAEIERERRATREQLELRVSAEEAEAAEARVVEAEAAVRAAERRAAAATVRSPIDGRLYSLGVRQGDYVSPGTLVARVAADEAVEAVIFVDEPELGRVSVGDPVTLTADAFPGRSWTCKVDRLPTEIVEQETRRVGEVRCTVAGETADLLPNLTANVAIRTARAQDAPTLPRAAVFREQDAEYVWTRDDEGLARRTPVEVGVRGADRVEIVSGLDVGDEALLPGAAGLEEGELVEVRP